jgi:hypothetical protein
MDAARRLETVVPIQKTTPLHIPEDDNLQFYHRDNMKLHKAGCIHVVM